MTTKNVAVTGGAGFIGSHAVSSLIDLGYSPIVIDDLSTGIEDRIPNVPLLEADLSDPMAIGEVASFLSDYGADAVLHFAAKKQVGESIANPLLYYRHNVTGTQHTLDACERVGVKTFVFSSTAAVYGSPGLWVVDERTITSPINPYGNSKLAGEWLCRDVARANNMRVCILRYFNVVGSRNHALRDTGAFNLLPIILDSLTKKSVVNIFGNDYPTPDGTCIRDYIHVEDIVDAHIAAMESLTNEQPGQTEIYNVGTGYGTSVLDLISLVESITGSTVPKTIVDRRPGDPPALSANVEKIQQRLGWAATSTLSDAIQGSWRARKYE